MGMKIRRDKSNITSEIFRDEIKDEHLDETPESLIPLTDLIADLHEGDGLRILHWFNHSPTPEYDHTDVWGGWHNSSGVARRL